MAIDKTWVTMRNRKDPAYWEGLQVFMELASKHKDCDGRIFCPCVKCKNTRLHPLNTVEAHIFTKGFESSYERWIYHGEPDEPVEANINVDADEMAGVIEDFFPPIDDDERAGDDEMQRGQYYDDMFEEIEAQLYPGCDWISSLNFIAKLMHLKNLGKIPNYIFDELLKLLKFAFPKENKIPATHYEAKKKLGKLGLGYESIHVCVNNCCLFHNEHASKDFCPVCGTSRWINEETSGKKVAHKVMRYFPLTPRLKRLYSSRHTSKEMVWHRTGRVRENGVMRHPVDSAAWKDFDSRHPDFARDPRNVRLGLAADGFNPFGNMSLSYSMWPVVLVNYNLPPWMCMKDNNFMLSLLIPGPKSPGKDMDVFLRPLVDELNALWTQGVETRDATTNSMFNMRAALLWTINDFPARSSLSGWSGQGYKACPTCNEDTTSIRVIGKTSYVGHRRFLPSNHRMRKDREFDENVEKRPPPRRFTCSEILEQVNALSERAPGKRKRGDTENNWRKKSIFYELEYWSANELKHNIDVMHVEKNVCDSILGTLLDNDKSKDTTNARQDLKNMRIRQSLWIFEDARKRLLKPHAPYVLTANDKQLFCKFLKDVKLPDGFCSNLKKKVTNDNIVGLKSHDCHVIMQRLLPVCIGKFLSKEVSSTIIELCNFFRILCSRTLNVKDMEKAQGDLIHILCKMERIYPPAFFDIMIHLVIHLPEEAILGGLVFMRWMYPFERYMKKLKNYVRNKARPEGSIAEGYVIDEALTFCSMYFKGVHTKFNCPERNEDAPSVSRYLTVYKSQCRPLGKQTITTLDEKTRKRAEWYILQNSSEIDPYMTEHLEIIAQRDPNANHNLLHKKEFPSWFHKKIFDLYKLGSLEHSDELLALAAGSDLVVYSYPACIVNGVRFVVHSRDKDRNTQNSGVSVAGTEGFDYFGELQEILHLSFSGAYSVVLFRCKWFNTDPRKKKIIIENNITSINVSGVWYKDDPYILASQAKQVFFVDDLVRGRNWRVVHNVHHRQVWENILDASNETDDVDVVHDTNSSNFTLSVDLGELNVQRTNDSPTIVDVPQSSEIVANVDDSRDDEDEEIAEDLEDDLLIDHLEDEIEEVPATNLHFISDDDCE
ncbi:hypothetical protein CsatB_002157 [Cannabis sativa]